MIELANIAWLAGLIALGVLAARAARRARIAPEALVDRSRMLLAALAAAALGISAAWIWGTFPADDGMARLADAPRGAARARVFIRAVSIPLAQTKTVRPERSASDASAESKGSTSIGYAPAGGVRLPSSYDLDEESLGLDLLDVTTDGPTGLTLTPRPRAEASHTRILLASIDRDHGDAPLDTDEAASLAARLLDHRACGASTGATSLRGPGAAIAVLCNDTTPIAALILERDLATSALRATPLVYRDNRFAPHQVDVAGGEVLEIGRAADIAPGLTAWEVPAPTGQARLLVPPDDVLAPCRAWSERSAIFARAATIPPTDDDAIACVLPYAPPFVLEVRRLVPDTGGVAARSLWAAGLFATVALFALV
ncbi:MAG TPA: hypothetical protein VL463_17910, partial [Kofleriaceae bacterium]|nr:hypothetical protein [Kofleriaceae bacterium]